MARRMVRRLAETGVGLVVLLLWSPAVALAHGVEPVPPADAIALLGLWSFDPTLQVPLIALAVAWISAVRMVDREHPANPVPRRRSVSFLLGLVAIELALQSPIEAYDTTFFSIHMIQHILLTLVAAPLIAYGAPITLLLRVSPGDVRRRWILPILHSRPVKFLTHPIVAWILFAGVMWGTHFSPLFNESLENPALHQFEHLLYLGAALLFWWPVIGADPSPWRMPHPARALYVFLQMPQSTFLALAIYSSTVALYSHYATLKLSYGPDPISDQQLAGGFMWVGGDLIFLVAILFVVAGWMKQEDRDMARADARQDVEREEIRRREVVLAERLARERQRSG